MQLMIMRSRVEGGELKYSVAFVLHGSHQIVIDAVRKYMVTSTVEHILADTVVILHEERVDFACNTLCSTKASAHSETVSGISGVR